MQIAQERYELENRLREEAVNYVSESITIDGVPLMSLMEIPEISFTYDQDTVMNWFDEVESSQMAMDERYMQEMENLGQTLWEAAQGSVETFSSLTTESYELDSAMHADFVNYVFETIQVDGAALSTAFPDVYESTLNDTLRFVREMYDWSAENYLSLPVTDAEIDDTYTLIDEDCRFEGNWDNFPTIVETE